MEKLVLPKTIVLVPDLNIPGGVSNYYRTLKLDQFKKIDYFQVNKAKHSSPPMALADLLFRYIKFTILLVKNKYAIVITNPSLEGVGKSFYREAVFILIAHFFRRKTIVFFRGWADHFEQQIRNSKFKSFIFRISYKRATQFLVLGNIFKQKLIGLGVSENAKFQIFTTVADATNINHLSLADKLETFNQEVKFLFLSRIEKIKGIYVAIDAYRKFRIRFSDKRSSLTIAGGGPDLENVMKYVKDENIQGIQFAGYVTGEAKRELLRETHILIFPSFTEGLPNTLLEGMLYGLLIISSGVGAIPEVIENNTNGFIADELDSATLYELMVKAACDNTNYKKISSLNHQTALDRYTTPKVRLKMLEIINIKNSEIVE